MSGQVVHDTHHQLNEFTEIMPPQNETLQVQSPRNLMNVKLMAAVTFLILSALIVIAITFVYASEVNIYADELEYGIVVEAGSINTLILVYQWPTKKIKNTGLITEKFTCAVQGPSIDSYRETPKEAANSLLTCLNQANEEIPKSHHSKARIYFAATSGMRLLEFQDSAAAMKILSEINNLFKTLPYRFGSIRILFKNELGTYSWIAANYLNDILVEIHDEPTHSPIKIFLQTFGSLYIGGTSTYITFTPKRNAKKFGAPTKVKLFGKKYKMYTYRFDCYGRLMAEKRYLVNLYQASGSKTTYESPCWPLGYNKTISMKDLFGNLCTISKRPGNYNPDNKIKFIGNGNPAKCKQLVYLLFDFKACAGKSYCSFDGVNIPTIRGKFMAFSGFYYMTKALNLPSSFTVTKFNMSLWSFCTTTWKHLLSGGVIEHEDRFNLRQYCFAGFLMYTLFIDGYKFTPEDWKRITFTKDVEGINVRWPLGYMINISNTIPPQIMETRSKIPSTTFHIVFSVFLSTGLISILVLCKIIF